MPTYYDPITLDDIEIDENTNIYLVRVHKHENNPQESTYGLKGISIELHRIPREPQTQAEQVWSVDTKNLLKNLNDEIRRT